MRAADLSYFYNTQIPGGSDPAVNIPGFAYFGREPYSYIQRVEQRYQFTDNFSWTMGRHNTKFGVDFNYIPTTAIFTVNYGGVYDFGTFSSASLGFVSPIAGDPFPNLSPCRPTALACPEISSRDSAILSDSFPNKPLGVFWQDSWRVRPNLTLNYGVRYDVEIPPQFKSPTRAGSGRIQVSGIAERNSDRHEQHSASHRHGMGSQRRWQDRGPRLLRNVL